MSNQQANEHVIVGISTLTLGLCIVGIFNDWSLRINGPVANHLQHLFEGYLACEMLPWLGIFPLGILMILSPRFSRMIMALLFVPFALAFLLFSLVILAGGVPVPVASGVMPVNALIPLFGAIASGIGAYVAALITWRRIKQKAVR